MISSAKAPVLRRKVLATTRGEDAGLSFLLREVPLLTAFVVWERSWKAAVTSWSNRLESSRNVGHFSHAVKSCAIQMPVSLCNSNRNHFATAEMKIASNPAMQYSAIYNSYIILLYTYALNNLFTVCTVYSYFQVIPCLNCMVSCTLSLKVAIVETI